ncbi:hypothetical protein C8R44DRAFT_747734 [Mycena epipterygia]|nr:hypothetical protein C8R44DRAFT_747734 [Mycena epipterygia]
MSSKIEEVSVSDASATGRQRSKSKLMSMFYGFQGNTGDSLRTSVPKSQELINARKHVASAENQAHNVSEFFGLEKYENQTKNGCARALERKDSSAEVERLLRVEVQMKRVEVFERRVNVLYLMGSGGESLTDLYIFSPRISEPHTVQWPLSAECSSLLYSYVNPRPSEGTANNASSNKPRNPQGISRQRCIF